MFWLRIISLSILLIIPSPSFSLESLFNEAESRFAQYDHKQAYLLFQKFLLRQPDHLPSILRVSELKLMFEGRSAVRDFVVETIRKQGLYLSTDGKRQMREKLGYLQGIFLTDDGQASFFQAMLKKNRQGCQEALPFLIQALDRELGNSKVLAEKATCERETQLWPGYYHSLKQNFDLNPYDVGVSDAYLEALAFFNEGSKGLALYNSFPEAFQSTKGRSALAYFNLIAGRESEAVLFSRNTLYKEKNPLAISYYILGSVLNKKKETQTEAMSFLEKFVTLATRDIKNSGTDAWDPFALKEKLEEVKKWVEEKKTETRKS